MKPATAQTSASNGQSLALAVLLCLLFYAANPAIADDRVTLQIATEAPSPPAAVGMGALLDNSEWLQVKPQRPRLAVALPTQANAEYFSLLPYSSNASGSFSRKNAPSVSWSLEAWQMNTASLAHIQCSTATQTLETFVVENCRFVDQPAPSSAVNLVQVEGRWMAAPGLQLGMSAFTAQQPVMGSAMGSEFGSMSLASLATGNAPVGVNESIDQVDGVSMNLSFGLQVGRIGDLILDLELSRYRRTPESFAARNGLIDLPSIFGPAGSLNSLENQYQNAGQLGLGWRKNQFSADLVGQYRELPYWFGPDASGEGFNSFDIEFSWRAPINSSISVGVSNILDSRPDAASAGDRSIEDSIESIYGRIPYVRFKHDL